MFPWCGVPAFLVAGQRTLKQSRIDVADSFWYRRERNQEKVALTKFWKQNRKKGVGTGGGHPPGARDSKRKGPRCDPLERQESGQETPETTTADSTGDGRPAWEPG